MDRAARTLGRQVTSRGKQMPVRCLVRSIYRRLLDRPAYMFLTACDEPLERQNPRRFARAWVGLMALSIATGLGLVGLWGVGWRFFGDDYGRFVMPAAAAVVFLFAWPMRRSLVCASRLIGGEDAAGRMVIGAMLIVAAWACFLCLKPDWYRAEYAMPGWLAWIRPAAKVYRVLLVMPVWGCWSMLITVQFCRPGDRTEQAMRTFAHGCGPLTAAGCMAVPLAGTFAYFHYLGTGAQWTIPAVTIFVAIFGGFVLSRLGGGLRRSVLLADNLLAQLAFVLTYLAFR